MINTTREASMRWFSILIVLTVFGVSDLYAQQTRSVDLAGYNKVPSVRTPATGTLEVSVEGDSLFVTGPFEDLRGHYWSAFIHYGSERESGNRLLRLKPELNEEKNGGEFKREDNGFELRPSQRDALREGKLYIQISSSRHQGGEIRGQIPAM
jgi:hypothetical protein